MKKILTTLLLPAAVITAEAAEQPNIIFIMADDLGWGDVGFNGNDVVLTPNLDKLSGEGVVFERFYSASAVSSPTRCSVLTGRNPYRNGIFSANKGIMRREEYTLPELLQSEGYLTGHFGKWHLGTLTDQEKDANRGRKGNSRELNPPALHGYDDSFTTESKVPTYDPMVAPLKGRGNYWDYIKEGAETRVYGTAYWRHDGTKETENLKGDDSRVIMDRVIPFIDRAQRDDRPFMSVVWFHAPHLPCVAGPEHQKLYSDYPLDKRNYYGCITAMDEQVGRLVEHLRSIGEFDNTVIFFCSDNGPEGKSDSPGVTSGLLGRKRSLHEGGIRVPGFVVWGDKIVGGGSIATPCFTSDYIPTVADILELPAITDHQLDGESLLPFVVDEGRGVSEYRSRPMTFMVGIQGAVIDNRYKLYLNNGVYELYDLVNDREEKHNIAAEKPALVSYYTTVLRRDVNNIHNSFSGNEFPVDFKVQQKWQQPKM